MSHRGLQYFATFRRRVNIEMITTAAATNAAIAVDSLNQNLHSAVSPIFGDDEAGTASTGEPAEVQVDATSEEAFGESRRPETIDIEVRPWRPSVRVRIFWNKPRHRPSSWGQQQPGSVKLVDVALSSAKSSRLVYV